MGVFGFVRSRISWNRLVVFVTARCANTIVRRVATWLAIDAPGGQAEALMQHRLRQPAVRCRLTHRIWERFAYLDSDRRFASI